MPDLNHQWAGDLSVTATGDIATVSGSTASQQRVLRRLLSTSDSYIWQLGYGAGLPGRVGDTVSVEDLLATVTEQMLMEDGVAQIPAPTVAVTTDNLGTVAASISYTDADSGGTITLTL